MAPVLREKWQLSWPDNMWRVLESHCCISAGIRANYIRFCVVFFFFKKKVPLRQVSVVSNWQTVAEYPASQGIVIPGDGAVCLCMLLPYLCACIGHLELIFSFCG